MTGRERVLAAAAGEEPDRVPVLPLARLAFYRWAGVDGGDPEAEPQGLAAALLAGRAVTGVDGLEARASYDAEVAALGGTLWRRAGFLPAVVEPWLVDSEADLARLSFSYQATPLARERELLRLVRRGAPDAAILSYVQGPLRLATRLAGPERVLRALLKEQDFLRQLLSRAVEISAARARSLAAAGADLIQVSDPYASPAVISPECYRTQVLPFEAALVAAVLEAGAVAVLHICGDTTPIFDLMLETQAGVVSLDAPVNLFWARRRAGRGRCLMGNVPPLAFMGGSLRRAARGGAEALRCGGRRAFILSAGCAVPPEAEAPSLRVLRRLADAFAVPGRQVG